MKKQVQKKIENLFTIVVILLFTEGIFRKWIFSTGGDLFLVLRDPFVLMILYYGIKQHLVKNHLVKLMLWISLLTFFNTMLFGHQNLWVAIYGVRITFLYFPAMYISGICLSREYVMKIGKYLLFLFIPILLVSIMQFLSPSGAWINTGQGSDDSMGVSAGELFMRPSSIFMYVTGVTNYYFVTFCFIVYLMIYRNNELQLSKWFGVILIIAYLISIPVSISRTHLFMTVIAITIYSIFVFKRQTQITILSFVAIIVALLPLLYSITEFSLFVDIFMARLTGANDTEGGAANSAINRTFGYAFNVMNNNLPFFGYGEGYCTNVGIKMIYGTVGISNISDPVVYQRLADSEMEWSRILTEDGPFLGLVIIMLRIAMALQMFKMAYRKLVCNDILPMLLIPPALIWVATASIKSPSNLAFMFMAGALFLAAYYHPKNN